MPRGCERRADTVARVGASARLGRLGRLLQLVLIAAIVAGSWRASGGPQDEITRRDWGIAGFRAPPRWEMLPHDRSSYPQLLAWASRGEGADRSIITLVARRVPSGTTYETLQTEARALKLRRAETVQVRVDRELVQRRVLVEADLQPTSTERRQVMRQLLLLNPPFAYALTLLAPYEQRQARQRDLEEIVNSLTLLTPEAPPPAAPPPPPPPPPPPDGGSAAAVDVDAATPRG